MTSELPNVELQEAAAWLRRCAHACLGGGLNASLLVKRFRWDVVPPSAHHGYELRLLSHDHDVCRVARALNQSRGAQAKDSLMFAHAVSSATYHEALALLRRGGAL